MPCVLQGEEVGSRLVFRLDEEQPRLASLQVGALVRTHGTFMPEPVSVNPAADRPKRRRNTY